ncbi:hypothetical protein [Actinomadura montaniterrae]|uniref:Uncharacterized protein n=1 Tax=Actinomadura montaniterrae TaxID=1803903 RepID=A0A6L3VX96_9ACTN|nr:hypothetical protein [Actinomadura montaniterrae]KAB2384758.1 hypothetical protein F9B16_09935 [Actinomadura montaniterrae]
MRVDLGKDKDGNERWAEVTDLDDMPRRVETAINRMLPPYKKGGDTSAFTPALMDRMRDALIAHLIEAWSFDKAPPKGNADKIDFLPRSAYLELLDATAPHWEAVGFTDPGKSKPSPAPDGKTSSG